MIVVSIIFFPCLFYFMKHVSFALGVKRQEAENDMLVTLNESLNGIKEMILYKWGVPVKRKYKILAEKLVYVSAYQNSFQDIGRYLIEIIGVLLVIFVIYFIQENSNTQNLLSILSVQFQYL